MRTANPYSAHGMGYIKYRQFSFRYPIKMGLFPGKKPESSRILSVGLRVSQSLRSAGVGVTSNRSGPWRIHDCIRTTAESCETAMPQA